MAEERKGSIHRRGRKRGRGERELLSRAKMGEKGKNVQVSRLAARKMGRESYIGPEDWSFRWPLRFPKSAPLFTREFNYRRAGNLDARSKSFIVILTTAPTFHPLGSSNIDLVTRIYVFAPCLSHEIEGCSCIIYRWSKCVLDLCLLIN